LEEWAVPPINNDDTAIS